jgi:class 3 adenylate cyclase/tetratricopeptide (TPR) repeat protein
VAEFGDGPLTILFSDVVGSTDLRTERGDAAAHRILRSHEEVVHRCVAAYDGREIKALGDGFMVAFGSARRALGCAIAIQQGLEERNRDSPGEELAVRIGINTGEVVVEGDDLYGQAVNAAARIASRARGGQILVSEIVRQLAGSGPEFTFVDRGRCRLKGFPERWHLYDVVYQASALPDSGAAFAARTPYVGRESERAELRRLAGQAKGGTGALVMIGGEPGVGKTRLAEELVAACTRDGFATYVGHCYEMAGAAPYVPIVEVYEQALARASSAQSFRQFLGEEAPQIARLLPELRQLCPDIPAPLDLPAEQERRYLFNSVWEVLARTAGVQPTLIVLDDIHWADEPTMLLIYHCAERVAQVPVLMVGLYRDNELDVGRPLSRMFEELTRRRLAQRLSLRRLPSENVADMLRALTGQDPPGGLVDVIYDETEGNPFFTEEVFKHLAEEGRLFDTDGRFRADLTVTDLDVPEGVRMVIGARLHRLGEDGPKVLGTAAVLGRVFSFDLLGQVDELAEDRLLDLVEEAERAGLIATVEEAGSADDRFIFSHELIRQTVLGGLSAPRRRRVHARAADVLEQVHAGMIEPQAATIVHHLIEAGPVVDSERTFRYLVMAGRWAQETAAFEEALAYLEEAAERVEVATPADRADLLFHLGTARRSNGLWDEAIDTWKEAIGTCEAAGDFERAGWICAEAADPIAWASRFEEAFAIAQRGLDLLGDEVSTVRARLLAQQGFILSAGGAPFAAGDALVTQAIAIADELGDPALRGLCLSSLCMNRFFWMHQPESADAGLEAAELLRAAGKGWEESLLLGFVQIMLVGAGRFAEARGLEAYVEPLAERLGNPGALMNSRRARFGMADFAETGDPVALETFGRNELKFLAENGLPWINHTHAWLGLALFLQGRWEQAEEHFETAVACEPPSAMYGWAHALLFEFRAYAGQWKEAMALLDKAGDLLPMAGQPNTWGRWAMLLSAVEGLSVMGESSRAGAFYDLVLEGIERTGTVCSNYNDCRLAHRSAGIAGAAAGRWGEAEGHFRIALRQAEELPHLPEQAHTRRFFARMLIDRNQADDGADAARMATEAADLYRRLGMPRHVAMAENLLA